MEFVEMLLIINTCENFAVELHWKRNCNLEQLAPDIERFIL